MIPLTILGTGEYLPQRVVPSTEFDERWKKPSGWTFRATGVAHRHVAAPNETSSRMGALAAQRALDVAGVQPGELDCIVSACGVMEQAIPCLGAQIQSELGLGESGIPAFDVNATCLSFLVALDLVSCAMAMGRYRKVLIVSSEVPSAGLNPDDVGTAPLFGDGAAAVVLGMTEHGGNAGLLATHVATYSVGRELCQVRAGGTKMRVEEDFVSYRSATYFEMDGKATYRLAARYLPAFSKTLLAKAGVGLDDLSCLVPHQASGKALDKLDSILGIALSKVIRTIHDRGNMVAASMPSTLHRAITSQTLQRGDLVALMGTGAGLSLGGAVLRY
jgi:3-oxoacyl-[acyl-carrier-protein] synthase-3